MQTNNFAEEDYDDETLAFVEKLYSLLINEECPFCHELNSIVHPLYDYKEGEEETVEKIDDITAYGVFCGTCGAGGTEGQTPQEAIKNWRRRA